MHRRTGIVAGLCLLWCLSVQVPLSPADEEPHLVAKSRLAKTGRRYRIVSTGMSKMDFELSRPSRTDSNVLLCIPAAFTAQDGGLCGLYASRGDVHNENLVDRKIGGALKMDGGKGKILDTNSGANLDAAFAAKLRADKSSFFQQFQVIKDGHAESFKDKTHFQRRCIAKFPDESAAVIESLDEITFNEFGEDLVEFGVQDAVYTDMGPWSEGWYRDGRTGKIITIGESRMLTSKQTNWFVLKKR